MSIEMCKRIIDLEKVLANRLFTEKENGKGKGNKAKTKPYAWKRINMACIAFEVSKSP